MQIEIDVLGMQLLQCANKINQRSADTVDGPRRNQIEFLPRNRLQKLVEPRALIAALGT